MIAGISRNKYIDLRPVQVSVKYLGRWVAAQVARHPLAIYILATGLVVAAIYFGAACTVTIPVDNQPVAAVRSFSRNVDELLTEIDWPLDPEDRVVPDPATPLSGQDEIQIEKAFPVFVLEDDSITEIWTPPQPVRALLTAAGFVIGPDDRVEPEGTVYPRAEIKILRAKKEISAARVQLEETRPGRPDLDRGSIRVYREGLTWNLAGAGVGEAGPEVCFQDGSPGPGIAALPGAPEYEAIKITGCGKTIKFSQVLDVTATAYCPGTPGSGCPLNSQGHSLCTGWYNDGYTCTGKKAVQGEGTLESPHIVAVDPRIIPLASKVYLEGIGFAVAEDIGGAIKGNRIDILFNLHQDAWEFGLRKGITLYILSETG